MVIHDFGDAVVVMDGQRNIATARQFPHLRIWLIRLKNASFIDEAAHTPNKMGVCYPHLWAIHKKAQVMRVLKDLARGGKKSAELIKRQRRGRWPI